MAQTERHDSKDCECIKYSPEFQMWQIRLNGINFLCRKCNRYVDPKKWKGGIVHFTNRSVFKPYYCCPCCGQRMSRHRIGKQKLINSLEHQVKFPEQHNPKARKILKKKIKLLQSNTLIPIVK